MSIPDDLQMLNPREVAGILGIHQKTVHLWLRLGKLEGVKISYRSWRIPKSALEAFINEHKNGCLTEREAPPGSPPSDKNAQRTQNPHTTDLPKPAQANMKFYIREIMGEEADKTTTHGNK